MPDRSTDPDEGSPPPVGAAGEPARTAVSFADDTPYSEQYQDVYFSRGRGLAESRHVFLSGNGLPGRWLRRSRFTIAETGFGTGLNFLAAWQAWRESAPADGRLHYLSMEKHPLTRDMLARCHAPFPELSALSSELLRSLPQQPLGGFHRHTVEDGRIRLTLCHGDAADMLRELVANVDCWFLDGFSPAKNPDMWSERVFREIARLSSRGTTFATFTAAGAVRRGLAAQGFRVGKHPGFGSKREMCCGTMHAVPDYRPREPWFAPPRHTVTTPSALVIGAGIAGAQAAFHLARRGWKVRVLERQSRPAGEASGNPAGVYSPFLTKQPSLEEQFSLQCYCYLLQHLSRVDPDGRFHSPCGVLALSVDAQQRDRARRIGGRGLPRQLVHGVSTGEADTISGLETGLDGLFYPEAGWIDPVAWVRALLNSPGIELLTRSEVTALNRIGDRWEALDDSGRVLGSAPVVIVASGRFMGWPQCAQLPFTPVAGQTSFIDSGSIRGEPRCVVRHHGYLVPCGSGRHLMGATYSRGVTGIVPDPASDDLNLASLSDALPQILARESPREIHLTSAHRAIRMTSESRLPLIGPVANPALLAAEYPRMMRRRYQPPTTDPVYPPGLYLSAAWGSRGLTNAPLGGEILAALICGEPLPLQAGLYRAIHPARSLVRALKRRPRNSPAVFHGET